MTAMTHAAIAACLAKLSHLINCYRSLDVSLSGWLDQVAVEQVLTGNDHPPPSRSRLVHIYAGTIYQVESCPQFACGLVLTVLAVVQL